MVVECIVDIYIYNICLNLNVYIKYYCVHCIYIN